MSDIPSGGPVSELLRRGSHGVVTGVRALLARINPRLVYTAWGAGTVVVFVGVLALGIASSRDVHGVLTGLFVGLFTALLYAVAMGSFVVWAYRPRSGARQPEDRQTGTLDRALAPVLRELDAARAEISRKVRQRSVARVPLGIAAALVLWGAMQWGRKPPDLFDLALYAFLGALAGEIWAIGNMDREYKRLFKTRVLPHLARQFGDLTYRPVSSHEVASLREHGILPALGRVTAEDEITGMYHGMPLSIVEVKVVHRSGKKRRVVFDGLLIDLTLPRSLTGLTAITPDAGMVVSMTAQWRSDGLERVRLEDPTFEAQYEVYGTDQIEARALLTPLFMERFRALSARAGVTPPGAIAKGNRFVIALPKRVPRDLFEPPSYWKASGGRVLVALSSDIRAALTLVDAVIELDFWAAGRKRFDSAPQP